MDGTLYTILISSATALAGYYLKYALDKRSSLAIQRAEHKQKVYKRLSDALTVFFRPVSDGNGGFIDTSSPQALSKRSKEFNKALQEFQKESLINASPAVVRAIAKYVDTYDGTPIEDIDTARVMRVVTNVFKAIRKDMGISNRFIGRKGNRLFAPLLMGNYYKEMHPILWRIRNKIQKVFAWPARKWREIKKSIYDWGAKQRQPAREKIDRRNPVDYVMGYKEYDR